jgi:hypothetical protein
MVGRKPRGFYPIELPTITNPGVNHGSNPGSTRDPQSSVGPQVGLSSIDRAQCTGGSAKTPAGIFLVLDPATDGGTAVNELGLRLHNTALSSQFYPWY